MPVFHALLYLRCTTLRNKLTGMVRRLRQPKYLMGALAAAAYFWFFFFRHLNRRGGPAQIFSALSTPDRIEIIAAIVFTGFLALIWMSPGDEPGLAFTEAEVAFLFPAPLARRQLIHYKLLDGLLMSLLGAVFFTLIAGGLNAGWLGALRKLGAWWSVNANLMLHQIFAALAVTRLSRLGVTSLLRRALIILGLVGLLILMIVLLFRSGPGSLAWVLWPARLAVRPFLADGLAAYGLALLPAFGLIALQYLVIHRLESPFEEASITRAQKTGETIARMRSGKLLSLGRKAKAKPGPFSLGDRLPVEAAFLWKNLMAAPAYVSRKVFLGSTLLIFTAITWLQHRPDIGGPKIAVVASFIALGLLTYLLIFGPQVARNDLRGDIVNADMLKAYPLPGWRMVLGSLLAPTVILTGIAWLFLLVAALGLVPPAERTPWLTPTFRITAGLCLAGIMPALCAVQLLVPNAATLIFPAWSQPSRQMGGGMEIMGQRLIFFAGQMLCLVLALIPALLIGGGTIFLTQWLVGLPASLVLATLPVLAVFIGELWLGVRLLGPRFERLDISDELRP